MKKYAQIADIRQQKNLRTISALNAAKHFGNAMNAVIPYQLLPHQSYVRHAKRSVYLET
jgi:hypothetical protein